MRSDETWQPIGRLVSGIVTRLRDEQMRRTFTRRLDEERFAAMCAAAGVDPASIPDAPMSEAAE